MVDEAEKNEKYDLLCKLVGHIYFLFQSIEQKIDEMALCFFPIEEVPVGHIAISKLSYAQRIDITESLVMHLLESKPEKFADMWGPEMPEIFARCRRSGEIRNQILHAKIEWRLVEGLNRYVAYSNKIKKKKIDANYFDLDEGYLGEQINFLSQTALMISLAVPPVRSARNKLTSLIIPPVWKTGLMPFESQTKQARKKAPKSE
jgi:hypothetical protein